MVEADPVEAPVVEASVVPPEEAEEAADERVKLTTADPSLEIPKK